MADLELYIGRCETFSHSEAVVWSESIDSGGRKIEWESQQTAIAEVDRS